MISTIIIATSVLAASGIVGAIVIEAGARLPLWPTPTPRPYVCHRCGVDYSDERALGWHLAGQHPATFDDTRERAGA